MSNFIVHCTCNIVHINFKEGNMDKLFFHKKLKFLIHQSIMDSYRAVIKFPKEELYGASNQLRRASVSIMLNYTEGYARIKPKVKINFLEISYGSLRECKYIIFLAKELQWISNEEYNSLFSKHDEIGKMLWKTITGMKSKL